MISHEEGEEDSGREEKVSRLISLYYFTGEGGKHSIEHSYVRVREVHLKSCLALFVHHILLIHINLGHQKQWQVCCLPEL